MVRAAAEATTITSGLQYSCACEFVPFSAMQLSEWHKNKKSSLMMPSILLWGTVRFSAACARYFMYLR